MSVLAEAARERIGKHILPDAASRSWSQALWRLRRELDHFARAHTWSAQDWKSALAYWAAGCRCHGMVLPGFDSLWARLKTKLRVEIQRPYGHDLACARALISEIPVPSELLGKPLEAVFRVLAALAEVAAQRGAGTFSVPVWLVAEWAGSRSHKAAHRHIGALNRLGYVTLVKSGTPGTKGKRLANEYFWHDPPRPGAASWNSSRKPGADLTPPAGDSAVAAVAAVEETGRARDSTVSRADSGPAAAGAASGGATAHSPGAMPPGGGDDGPARTIDISARPPANQAPAQQESFAFESQGRNSRSVDADGGGDDTGPDDHHAGTRPEPGPSAAAATPGAAAAAAGIPGTGPPG